MDTYVCHKKVKAAKVIGEYCRIVGPSAVSVEGVWINGADDKAELKFFAEKDLQRMRASRPLAGFVGGYYVEYDDGYMSWSPARAFEDGYTKE